MIHTKVLLDIVKFSLILSRKRIFQRKFSSQIDEDLSVYLQGRKNRERKDSVTKKILFDRKNHQERLGKFEISFDLINKIKNVGLGSKKRKNLQLESHSLSQTSHVAASILFVKLIIE
jgi:hypothetical protein